MLQYYYSSYNFLGWILSEFNLIPVKGPLTSSIITTSIVGAYFTHVYPRSFKIKNLKGEIRKLTYYETALADLIFHHLPLFRLLFYLRKRENNNNLCGFPVYGAGGLYLSFLYLSKKSLKKMYGLSDIYPLLMTSTCIFSIGFHHHIFNKNFSCFKFLHP